MNVSRRFNNNNSRRKNTRTSNLTQTRLPFAPLNGRLQRVRHKSLAYDHDQGDVVTKDKPRGVTRLIFGSIDNLGLSPYANRKAEKIKELMRQCDADGFAGTEAGVDWARVTAAGKPYNLFRTENKHKVVYGYNSTESVGLRQWGGYYHVSIRGS